jgi:hypothetical protein
MLVCIDFLRSFDLKIFPSPKKTLYTTRNKQNLRRLKLIEWAVRFISLLKASTDDSDTIQQCYARISRLFTNQKGAGNSLIHLNQK